MVSVAQFRRTCTECGIAFCSGARHADFCCALCRKAFNNRRMVRGAELYDLMMVLRCERGIARIAKVWTMICHLVSIYREEDQRQRAGRKSWRPVQEIIARRPYLNARAIAGKTWKRAA